MRELCRSRVRLERNTQGTRIRDTRAGPEKARESCYQSAATETRILRPVGRQGARCLFMFERATGYKIRRAFGSRVELSRDVVSRVNYRQISDSLRGWVICRTGDRAVGVEAV